ncbi:hypothetical protein BJF82_03300 [Kytococcus sp. CUA-901]|nr:hypothetical protein BJF82_03300 [Kytococcus sp. CUA-901]
MPEIASIARDLKALGPLAPVRAGYEALKRSGMHGRILDAVVSRAETRPLHAITAFRPTGEISPAARKRALTDAVAIREEGHRAFGRRIPVNSAADWSTIHPDAEGTWPVDAKWWDIDIRTDARVGDVKWTWEIGRYRDMVVMARAALVDPEGPWLDDLTQRLAWWFEATPLETSVHWYSNLEVALRCIAWAQIHALVGERLPEQTVSTIAQHVAMSRNHLLVDFPYTFSSMRNNHLLGDSLGLMVIERLRGTPGSWVSRIAEVSFKDQLKRHMRPDGSMIEDSLSYHRFVLEMLAVKNLIGAGTPESDTALRTAAEHLVNLGAVQGPVPQHGDWDEGRVLADSGDALSVRGSALLGLALTGSTLPVREIEQHDELAWYAAARHGAGEAPSVAPLSTTGGITRLEHAGWTVWLKHGTATSHQHADISHVSIRRDGQWITVDPGTGTYNGPLDVRNAFRTSHAHNGVRPDGAEMLEPHRAFRWLSGAATTDLGHLQFGDTHVLWSAHDAFARTGHGVTARAVLVSPTAVSVHDWSENATRCTRTVAFPDGAQVAEGTVTIGGTQYPIEISGATAEGNTTPPTGFHSPTYGTWVPAPWIVDEVGRESSWSIGSGWDTSGQQDATVAFSHADGTVRLAVTVGGHSFTDELTLTTD